MQGRPRQQRDAKAFARLFQPSGDVHRPAMRGVVQLFARADVAHHQHATFHADAGDAKALVHRLGGKCHPVGLQSQTRFHGLGAVVGQIEGGVEQHMSGVADEFFNHAAVVMDDHRQPGEIAVKNGDQIGGRQGLGIGREARDVGEQSGDLTRLSGQAGKAGLGATEFLNRNETLALLPNSRLDGPGGQLKGGVKYWDGQFDDARLALALARTAATKGALLVNYCAATGLIHQHGKVVGLHVKDGETGKAFDLKAKSVINATGVWVDQFRMEDGEALGRGVKAMVAPSQGVHIVVERSFLPGDHAMLVPKTADGRVLFAVPWLGKTILGTTDTPRDDIVREPLPFKEEVDFILKESARYLTKAPARADIKSIWVGLRPLVKPADDDGDNTKGLSREHTVLVSKSGLVTVTGGKWTTYRAMAEDVLDRCFTVNLLPSRPAGVTTELRLVGAQQAKRSISDLPGIHLYGSEAAAVLALPGAENQLGGNVTGLTEAMVRYAARFEYARTVEDVLARRSRLLFLDAAMAKSLGPQVAAVLQQETDVDPALSAFLGLCDQYLHLPD